MNKLLVSFLLLICVSCIDKPKDNPLLHRFAAFENRFRFFFLEDKEWVEAVYSDSIFTNTVNQKPIEHTQVFVVSYRNGDFIYKRGEENSLPDSVQTEIESDESFLQKKFFKKDLETGSAWCEVIHEKSPVFKFQKNYFQTRLNNISDEKIKVLRMGRFVKLKNNEYRLFTPDMNYFSSENFKTWYTEDDSEWIAPGASVYDPINRSVNTSLWAYHIETESGEKYWVSKLYEKE